MELAHSTLSLNSTLGRTGTVLGVGLNINRHLLLVSKVHGAKPGVLPILGVSDGDYS